ncbi:MAG: ribosome hibernation-promoting factor, HPF/YfiA family [Chloroflexota bacterium]
MQLLIKGKNIELTEAMRAHVEKKVGRLDRFLDNITQTEVEVSNEKTRAATDRFVVEVTMFTNGTILRGEEKAGDVFSAVDSVLDVMQRRLTRYKEKLYKRGRHSTLRDQAVQEAIQEAIGPVSVALAAEDEEMDDDEYVPRLVRTKRVAVKPMSEAEAAEQMELLGHDFFLFYNASTDKVSVIYRRHDGDYGLLEPELGA